MNMRILVVALSNFLSLYVMIRSVLAAQHHDHGHSRLAANITPADAGRFIYIDCGASEDSRSIRTGLVYKRDTDCTESGETKFISPEFRKTYEMQYWSLRYFPEGKRNCYTVKVEEEDDAANKNNSYLIRAVFMYGNYDGKNQTPVFDLYLDVNVWVRMAYESTSFEAVYVPSTNYIQVCLVNIGTGIPYITALEIRRVDNSIYPMMNGKPLLFLGFRYDIAASLSESLNWARYPDDFYDRFWRPYQFNDSNTISTEGEIPDNNFKVPQSVLKTACRAPNSSTPLKMSWDGTAGSDYQYYYCFHFVEIEKLKTGQFREMIIHLSDEHATTHSIRLDYMKQQTICTDFMKPFTDRQNYFSISATSNSSELPPILNALEFFYSWDFFISPTFSQDIKAIIDIKQSYKVKKNWQGDPCLPTSFIWDGLYCSGANSTRITSLNLSRSKLIGDIVFSFSNLTELESLDLSYNDLRGPIPEFLSQLPRLKILNLSGNNLVGSVPLALLQKSKNETLVLSVNENPGLCLSPPCKQHKSTAIPSLLYIIAAIILTVLIILGTFIIIARKRKQNSSIKLSRSGSLLNLKNRHYSYVEILRITDNFKIMIGEGGFGKVYLGTLEDSTQVAVKVLSSKSNQGFQQFQAEAQLLMIVHHQNLVSLVGICDEGDNKMFIYEYMANGNLKQHLSAETGREALGWIERLQISVDTARGLEYLHNGCKPPIIHRDMKTTNILLDERMKAKISDFGLSRIFASETDSHLSTCAAGTFGYIDPVIHASGKFTKKSDVYSYGIVLLELITGQPAIIKGSEYGVHIVEWVKPLALEGNIENIADARLKGAIEHGSAEKFVKLALSCTVLKPEERPDISCVVTELIECLNIARDTTTTQPVPPANTDVENYSYVSIGSESDFFPR